MDFTYQSASGAIQGHHGPLVICLLYKSFKNTGGKGEIAHKEQFLLFPQCFLLFSSPEHEVLRVSYCDHSPSVVRPSVVRSHFLVYTLASTNINQSAPNLVQVCMTIRSRMSSIMELIGPELSELSALELENLPYLTLFTL